VDEPEPVILPIEDALDLHPFAPRDVRSVVDEYVRQAMARGFREVRLIHGKGTGTQRAIVRSVLTDHPAVLRFFDGPPERGGWGATVVVLRPSPGRPAGAASGR
jgi:DNA-nicking Smr family endonuclease